MSYVMFIAAEAICAAILYFTYRGVFDIYTAFVTVILMLALSFHVMVRKPDSTSIRMACFTTSLWLAALFSARLFLEFRGIGTSAVALIIFLISAGAAGASTYALLQRPLELDVEN